MFPRMRATKPKPKPQAQSPAPQPPKKLSLHIGLNNVNNRAYPGYILPTLAGCHNDSLSMQHLARLNGYQPVVMLDAKGTIQNVKNAILHAASSLKAGDSFFLTYSGHGDQVKNLNPAEDNEADGKDETWCLYDGNLVDDVLTTLLAQFAAGVKIVVLADCCHSGTGVDTCVTMSAKTDGRIPASVVFFSGCQDSQYSLDGTKNGLFTETLLRVWNNGRFAGNYRQLLHEIASQMPDTQQPNMVYITGDHNIRMDLLRPFN